ncbi:hypothetical protein COCON_G00041250 [Conger conger]|uniref:Ig-like domain-containing protein n=1 Tax=Conger conger TaxID=82655 RepID=A0A9Q1DTT1_CONCO|nr:hypothetical protein COCON_G00041250 [Conger conger]
MKRMLGPLLKLLLLLTTVSHAPVSPPELSQLCQPHGEIRAWCSSTGEAPQYSWTLNDRPLDGGVAFLSNETQTVILKRDIPGSITCTVSNHVSKESTTQKLLTCPAPVSPPELSQLCQPHGEIRAWCSSTGEAPQYSWTLNDRPLDGGVAFLSDDTQTVILKRTYPDLSPVHSVSPMERFGPGAPAQGGPQYSWTLNDRPLDGGVAFLSNETQTVILKRDIPGSITCTVSNHVSKESTTQKLLTCPASV